MTDTITMLDTTLTLHETMTAGKTETVRDCHGYRRAVGFIERVASGGWRGYRYDAGVGYGPFITKDEAIRWVKGTGGGQPAWI